jgi:DNA-directed RNA polymerase specialized sigma24 family protein
LLATDKATIGFQQDIASHSAGNSKGRVSNDVSVALVPDNYAMYINKCYAYLKCRKLAEDAVQEGILAAHLSLASVKGSEALGAWFYHVIIRKAIDSLRHNLES